jgi:hypothetical protein
VASKPTTVRAVLARSATKARLASPALSAPTTQYRPILQQTSREVADGARTRDRWHHKPELYQLSYCHHDLLLQCIGRLALGASSSPTPAIGALRDAFESPRKRILDRGGPAPIGRAPTLALDAAAKGAGEGAAFLHAPVPGGPKLRSCV